MLAELHRLCRENRIYEVENWIRAGKPLQASSGVPQKGQMTSALEIAVDARNHALIILLLCNGYDPNLERNCPLNTVVRARRWDLINLLLEWGADPLRVSVTDLFDTYNAKLIDQFRNLGVDLTANHELADALGYHTSNKPLFGYVKRHRDDPKFQMELNMALAHHTGKGNEKGVAMCLGPVPSRTLPCRVSSTRV